MDRPTDVADLHLRQRHFYVIRREPCAGVRIFFDQRLVGIEHSLKVAERQKRVGATKVIVAHCRFIGRIGCGRRKRFLCLLDQRKILERGIDCLEHVVNAAGRRLEVFEFGYRFLLGGGAARNEGQADASASQHETRPAAQEIGHECLLLQSQGIWQPCVRPGRHEAGKRLTARWSDYAILKAFAGLWSDSDRLDALASSSAPTANAALASRFARHRNPC